MKIEKIKLDKNNRMFRVGFGKNAGKKFVRIDLWSIGFRLKSTKNPNDGCMCGGCNKEHNFTIRSTKDSINIVTDKDITLGDSSKIKFDKEKIEKFCPGKTGIVEHDFPGTNTNLNKEEIFENWVPFLEKIGIIDIEKQNILAEYCELHNTYKTTDVIFQQPGYVLKDDVNIVLDNKKEMPQLIPLSLKIAKEMVEAENMNKVKEPVKPWTIVAGSDIGKLSKEDEEKMIKFRNDKGNEIKQITSNGKQTIQLSNYLLTDFNTEKWSGISKENINKAITEFVDKTNKIGVCYGELEHPDTLDISFKNITHCVKHIKVEDEKIYANTMIFGNNKGLKVQELFKNDLVKIEPGYNINANNELTLYTFDFVTNIKFQEQEINFNNLIHDAQ